MMEVYKIQRGLKRMAGADWSRADPRWDTRSQGKAHSMQEVTLHPAAVHLCCQGDPVQAKGGDLIATEELNTPGSGNPPSRK